MFATKMSLTDQWKVRIAFLSNKPFSLYRKLIIKP